MIAFCAWCGTRIIGRPQTTAGHPICDRCWKTGEDGFEPTHLEENR